MASQQAFYEQMEAAHNAHVERLIQEFPHLKRELRQYHDWYRDLQRKLTTAPLLLHFYPNMDLMAVLRTCNANFTLEIDENETPARSKGRRILRKGAERREVILDFTEQLILAGRQMNTNEIQKVREMAGGTIYAHFASIHHLVRAACYRLFNLVRPKD